MSVLTEATHAGEFLLSEGNGRISRESVTVASGQNLVAGTVIGTITASGKVAAYDNTAVDGTATATGILWDAVNATAADRPGAAIVRLAEVNGALLTGNDAAGTADLAALNIIVR